MSIQDLPDELLYQMCEGWDNHTLLNMAESYSRVYQVCSDIIENRRQFEQQIVDMVLKVQGRQTIYFEKQFPDNTVSSVTLNIPLRGDFVAVYHTIEFIPKKGEDINERKRIVSNIVPPIIPTVFQDGGSFTFNEKVSIIKFLHMNTDRDSISALVRSLLKQGYTYKIITY